LTFSRIWQFLANAKTTSLALPLLHSTNTVCPIFDTREAPLFALPIGLLAYDNLLSKRVCLGQ
jgi:hypothetical protein